jgi:hypothetical protein
VSAAGSGSIQIKGKGENLSPGELPLALPATVRLVRSDAYGPLQPVCGLVQLAGADILDVEATAAKDDQVLNRWKTGSGSIVGGLIRPGMDGRFERLISTTAQRIVAGL